MQVGGSAWRRLWHVFGCALALMSGYVASASAGPADDAIDRGTAQLQSAFSAGEGFGTRLDARDVATVGEALRAYRPSSPLVDASATFLGGLDVTDVDSRSRVLLGASGSSLLSGLLAAQQRDGGFGLTDEYQSDPLDTALALRALSAAGEKSAAVRAAARLIAFQQQGAWGEDGGDVLLTGEATLALTAFASRWGATAAIDASRVAGSAWLAGRQLEDGAWAQGGLAVRSTATAVAALAAFPSQVSAVRSGAASLIAAQRADGSWGDPFSTGLAIRALGAALKGIAASESAQLADPLVRARDLTLSPATVQPGEAVTLRAVVSNPGPGIARDVEAELYLDEPQGSPVATATLAEIAPAASVVLERTVTASVPAGRHKLFVVLRPPFGADRDLDNNRAYANLFVRASPATYPKVRDWPRPGRDIQHSASSPNRLHAVVDGTPLWRHRADGAMTVAENKVFFGLDLRVQAISARTGEDIWRAGPAYEAGDRYRAPLYNRGFTRL